MAPNEEMSGHGRESVVVAGMALLAVIYGIILAICSSAAINSDSLQTIDTLVSFKQTYSPEAFVLTTMTIFHGLLLVSSVVVVVGLVGVVASLTHHKGFVSFYVLVSTVLAVMVIIAGVGIMERRQTLDPLVKGQVDDLCNGTTYMRLSMNMGCEWTSIYNENKAPPCGVFCQDRVESLKALDGCTVLPQLCDRFMYEELLQTDCDAMLASSTETMYGAAFGMGSFDGSWQSCEKACDADIMCTSYLFDVNANASSSKCVLTAALPATHLPPQWIQLTPASVEAYFGSEPKCLLRTKSYTLHRFQTFDFRLALLTLVLGIFLAFSACGTCLFMYNINVRREGKPDAHSLCYMMVCPCLAGEYKRFTVGEDSDHEAPQAMSSRDLQLSSLHNTALPLVTNAFAHGPPAMANGPQIVAYPGYAPTSMYPVR